MNTTIEVNIVDTDMVLTNSKGDEFIIRHCRRNEELLDFFFRAEPNRELVPICIEGYLPATEADTNEC